ncbi:MAG: hypothetical protein ACI9UT_003709 [Flavobacteriales bacterium]|jgi:hypothetical protein
MFNNAIIKLVLLSMSIAFGACSSLSDFIQDDKDIVQDQTSQTSESVGQRPSDEMLIHLEEWRKMKPSIKRLVAIESELKELIGELNTMTQQQSELPVATQPESIPTQTTKYQRDDVETPAVIISALKPLMSTVKDTSSERPKENSIEKKYAIQLGSMTDKSSIITTWETLTKKHSILLSGLIPVYEEAVLRGKIYYRLKAGGFETEVQAVKLCNKLQLLNVPCFSSTFIGESFL